MNRILLVATLVLALTASVASATLIDRGNGSIFDDVANQYWYQDLSYFVDSTYATQISDIKNLQPLADAGDWRMATLSDMLNLWAYSWQEIDQVFTPSAIRYGDIYRGRYDEIGYTNNHFNAWIYPTYPFTTALSTYQTFGDTMSSWEVGAWVASDANVAPVPEPSTVFLLGSGLLGLVWFGRKRKNS